MSGVPPDSIRALRARGGRPIDLPDALLLGEVAGYGRLVARDRMLASVEAERASLDPHPEPEDEARRVWLGWVVELLGDDGLAEWFLAGLPDAFVRAQLADAARDREPIRSLAHDDRRASAVDESPTRRTGGAVAFHRCRRAASS